MFVKVLVGGLDSDQSEYCHAVADVLFRHGCLLLSALLGHLSLINAVPLNVRTLACGEIIIIIIVAVSRQLRTL